jgi:hypothetical protein
MTHQTTVKTYLRIHNSSYVISLENIIFRGKRYLISGHCYIIENDNVQNVMNDFSRGNSINYKAIELRHSECDQNVNKN